MCVILLVLFFLFFMTLQAYSQGLCCWTAGASLKENGMDYEYQELTKNFDSDGEGEDHVLYSEKPISTVSNA